MPGCGPCEPVMKRATLWLLILTLLFTAPAYAAEDRAFSRETPVVRAVRLAGPAVVNINTKEIVHGRSPFHYLPNDEMFNRFFKDFFEPFQRDYTRSSLGSGVIIDGRQGLVLTNEHVVARATEIKVTLGDEREFIAELVGSDPDSDLAVLQIQTDQPLPSLPMGDSSDLMIGETVIAIGNPFGLTHTVTTGVISAVDRSLKAGDRVYRHFIQTDASINPGNSGGPLLNINGELIGINTAIYDRAEGIGFAIPIDKAKRIVKDLISYGEVQPVWLGLSLQSLDERLAAHFRTPNNRGALITAVDRDGPAHGSDLAKGDVVVSLDKSRVDSVDDYEDLLKGYANRDTVTLTVYRQGKPRRISLRAVTLTDPKALELGWKLFGLRVAEKPRDRRMYLEVGSVRRGSPSDQIGLKSGDIIHRVNEIETESRNRFAKAMAKYRLRKGVTLVVQRQRTLYRITLTR